MLCLGLSFSGMSASSVRKSSSRGSVLIVCLVLLLSLSTVALSALEAAWSGQRMVSAYGSHQQNFLQLERELLATERLIWQQIFDSGLEYGLSTAQDIVAAEHDVAVNVYAEWTSAEFSTRQCGPLFALSFGPGDELGSELRISVQWDVCCESREFCEASEFAQRRRLWSRQSAGTSQF